MNTASQPLPNVDAVVSAVAELTWPDAPRPDRIGLEVEAFPIVIGEAGAPGCRLALDGAGGVADTVARITDADIRNRVTFEPGGQVEYSSRPAKDSSTVLDEVNHAWGLLSDAFAEGGAALASFGIDPWHQPDSVPQQLDACRYRAMDRHYAAIGPSGAEMMRNSCSLQVNLDSGQSSERIERWVAANLVAPLMAAVFSTSPGSGGVTSRRARVWQSIDRTRTGLPEWTTVDEVDPLADTLQRTLSADVMYVERDGECFQPGPGWTFADWLENGHPIVGPPSHADLVTHLSTLFHEVRARRGTLEIRSIDALPRRWWPVPVFLWQTVLYDPAVRSQTIDTLSGFASRLDQVWRVAATQGLTSPEVGAAADKVTRLASDALSCTDGVDLAQVGVVGDFFDRYTWRSRTPGDELGDFLSRGQAGALAWASA